MNKQRRKWISSIIEKLEDIQNEISQICEEEQESFDNLPESIQYSERGDAMENYISNLESGADGISDVIDYLNECLE